MLSFGRRKIFNEASLERPNRAGWIQNRLLRIGVGVAMLTSALVGASEASLRTAKARLKPKAKVTKSATTTTSPRLTTTTTMSPSTTSTSPEASTTTTTTKKPIETMTAEEFLVKSSVDSIFTVAGFVNNGGAKQPLMAQMLVCDGAENLGSKDVFKVYTSGYSASDKYNESILRDTLRAFPPAETSVRPFQLTADARNNQGLYIGFDPNWAATTKDAFSEQFGHYLSDAAGAERWCSGTNGKAGPVNAALLGKRVLLPDLNLQGYFDMSSANMGEPLGPNPRLVAVGNFISQTAGLGNEIAMVGCTSTKDTLRTPEGDKRYLDLSKSWTAKQITKSVPSGGVQAGVSELIDLCRKNV
jgi:hypothetical protein